MAGERRPVSDPEAEGLPGTADDDSTAYDDVDSARIADGPDPAALPADHPIASLDYGTTPREASTPEPLDDRLAREEPDLTAEPLEPAEDVTGISDVDVLPASDDLSDLNADQILDSDDPGRTAGIDEDSPGRLVAPDEGAHADQEGTAIATGAGAAGGGLSAEEAAMHEEP
ncbi:DUF5709 domain-containing protein [Kribbella sp. CA-293567]|uniref:DUF5709 domain-containing protein n=1 Tax=Kribbella sp. CA-293567 TaxID=3002436 RepID=UPI0022DD9C32|nr:DUF5709 domain-containing protein [Kribbella sp. CA-293567]WBQ04494.1 DUF5709 domain-containing protein [Kribbella sp. CA-293567]